MAKKIKSSDKVESSANTKFGYEVRFMCHSPEFAESAKLEQAIKANLKGLGYGS